jgi:hypothetical protein
MQEAENGRITVLGQSRQKNLQDPPQQTKLGMVAHICHPGNVGKLKQEDRSSDQPGKKGRPYLQNNQSKRAGDVGQGVEQLPRNKRMWP